MAYQQTPTRANVELLKSSAPGLCGGRMIRLNYGPQLAPAQLQGRVDPTLWTEFMGQVQVLADRHPYLVKPGGKQYSNWIFAALVGEDSQILIADHAAKHQLDHTTWANTNSVYFRCCHWPFLF